MPRRSDRIKKQKRINKNKSPSKKRKHDEIDEAATDGKLPDYFYVHECSQESDPEFVPDGDGDDNDFEDEDVLDDTGKSEHFMRNWGYLSQMT